MCSQQFEECEKIGKAAHISTDLIYELFDAERVRNNNKRADAINQITQLYEANKIDVLNKRLKLSEFFKVKKDKIFGGYAVLIRGKEIQALGRKKISYIIAFKGTYAALEDPNDLAAGVSAVPVNLYQKASVLIHEGFRNYAAAVFKDVKSRELLAEILSLQNQKNTDFDIFLTGHSLGGAAILYAAMLIDAGVLPSHINVIVFGTPPIAQSSFVSKYQKLIPRINRVETEGDLAIYTQQAPMKPIYDSLGYVPIGKLMQTETTQRLVMLNKEKMALEKKYQASPSDKLRFAYLALMQKILEEQVAIHVYSYKYYYQYYLRANALKADL